MSRPRVVLVHGSATDHTTWSIYTASPFGAAASRGKAPLASQLGSSLKDRFELVAPDRDFTRTTVAEHAADLAAIAGAGESGPALVVGSSFGAVIALELARTRPAIVAGMI
jgi:pimeloyl-ACP methyl ester carboxylesterase